MVNSDFKLALVCGGPSLERGISLNSARSVVDHLVNQNISISIFYLDQQQNIYLLSREHIYSNTPQDFDFKLNDLTRLTNSAWLSMLKNAHLVFSVMHGEYGEDGEFQAFLEQHDIPFIGSGSEACRHMFFKDNASKLLRSVGWPTLPSSIVESPDDVKDWLIKEKRLVLKPAAGGSSIGVKVVQEIKDLKLALTEIKKVAGNSRILAEQYCKGQEFTIVVLEGENGPTALIPTEIEIDVSGEIFCYRRKYLPTANTCWHCPPRFPSSVVEKIRLQAEKLFKLFKMRDVVRIDGWYLPSGEIIFSDFNPMSGLEQNSLIFLQSSRVGMSHSDVLLLIINQACSRYGLPMLSNIARKKTRKRIRVLMGGSSDERQVSLMSGTNVWLKLYHSNIYEPVPYFLDENNYVWNVSYTHLLNHTTEEVTASLKSSIKLSKMLSDKVSVIREKLGLRKICISEVFPAVRAMSLDEFCISSKRFGESVFIALHGGIGEDGTIQKMLSDHSVAYNGSHARQSALGMDKLSFGQWVNDCEILRLSSLKKKTLDFPKLTAMDDKAIDDHWEQLCISLSTKTILFKPRYLGCSTGIEVIEDKSDFVHWLSRVDKCVEYIAEPYIAVDPIYVINNQLHHKRQGGWIELTVVVWERLGLYIAKEPSITLAKDKILTLEEKFQGGTGVNITPPPTEIIDRDDQSWIKSILEELCKRCVIKQYVRVDVFFNVNNKELLVIEMNTLPALTPSTVLYHQMLASRNKLSPLAVLEEISSTLSSD